MGNIISLKGCIGLLIIISPRMGDWLAGGGVLRADIVADGKVVSCEIREWVCGWRCLFGWLIGLVEV